MKNLPIMPAKLAYYASIILNALAAYYACIIGAGLMHMHMCVQTHYRYTSTVMGDVIKYLLNA